MKVFNINTEIDKQNLNKIISLLKNNKIIVSPHSKVFPYQKKLWFENPLNSRYYTFQMQSLNMVDYLLMYYEKYADDECLAKAMQLFYLWYDDNFVSKTSKNFTSIAYHNETIAIRLLIVVHLLSICLDKDLCLLEETFLKVISSHCQLLSDEYVYINEHHYGIDQDIALLVASKVYNHYYIKDAYLQYIQLAKKRLKAQLEYFIGEDGSFYGHSLQIAYIISLRINNLLNFINKYDEDKDFNLYIKSKLESLLVFIYAMTEPFGYLPPIGDSSYIKMNKHAILKCNYLQPHFEYLFSNGNNGKKLISKHAFFKKANYFITASDESLHDDFYKLLFYSANHSNFHKHPDDLAFILYYKNLQLFIDSGKYNYQSENNYRKCVTSIYAHNTICVDYEPYPLEANKTNHSGIINVVIDDDFVYASGISCLYENVIIRRNIIQLPYNLLIIDDIDAKSKHDYEINFNLNPLIDMKRVDKEYFGYLKSEQVVQIKNLYFSNNLDSQYHYGNRNELIGFMSRELNKFEPSHHITYHTEDKKTLIITQVILGKHPMDFEIEQIDGYIVICANKTDVYKIKKTMYYQEIYKNNVKLDDIKNKNQFLINSIYKFYQNR